MISFTEYEAYFEKLATNFKPISHNPENVRFAIMDIDDILSAQRTALDFTSPCMILENFEGELAYKHNQLLDQPSGAFHILLHVKPNDPAQKRTAMDLCKSIGVKILSRMQLERMALYAKSTEASPLLYYFQLSQVKYMKVSNIFGGCHGWRFEFPIGKESILPYDEDEWYSNHDTDTDAQPDTA
jgi:hypothetical protein